MSEMTKITVNGRTYDSIEQMPPDVLQEYLRAMAVMHEGKTSNVPDRTVISESIIYNGKEYGSRDELPPEVRTLLAQMPTRSIHEKTTNVEIKTIKTFRPRVSVTGGIGEANEELREPEKDPVMAWLLVKILSVVVVILLILLGLKHIGW